MDHQEILTRVDHTLLTTTATWEQVKVICDEAMEFKTASVCIPPCYVEQAARYMDGKIKVCTVIGFPNGYHTKAAKVFETCQAVKEGAEEIDMVINLGMAKSGNWDALRAEIAAVKEACQGRTLKVIVEACQLTREEKVAVCHAVTEGGAEFIKTSTGFSTGGATVEDVLLFREHIGPQVKIKAAGGIRTFEQAQAMMEAGADRIGASALVALARKEK